MRADGGRARHDDLSRADSLRSTGVVSAAMLRADGVL
jgi:hypothetical protein